MILRTVIILCCISLQQVTAEPTIWDLFNWKITLQRQRQDEITLRGLIEASVAQDDVKIPGATCSESKEWTGETGLPGFLMQCKCNLSSSTFAPELMRCVANSKIKRGIGLINIRDGWSWII